MAHVMLAAQQAHHMKMAIDGGRKISTAKQLAVALMATSVSNTTVLLMKPDFQAPYHSACIPSIPNISELYNPVCDICRQHASNMFVVEGSGEVAVFLLVLNVSLHG